MHVIISTKLFHAIIIGVCDCKAVHRLHFQWGGGGQVIIIDIRTDMVGRLRPKPSGVWGHAPPENF